MVEVRTLHEAQSELLTALSTITVPLTRDHFTEFGRLKVRCTASLYTLYWQITENSAELERPRAAVVAASNQGAVDTRAIWRGEEKLAGKQSSCGSECKHSNYWHEGARGSRHSDIPDVRKRS